jgi:F-box-like
MVLPRVTIGSLPGDVLLEIFYAYYRESHNQNYRSWCSDWLRLVHVCRRWRFVIFASPHHLDLQLLCTLTRPVRKMLDIWPEFPLMVDCCDYTAKPSEDHFDNLIAALERRDRVHEIRVRDLPGSLWERISTVAQEPFLALTTLEVAQSDGLASGDIFFNVAPNLQHLYLCGFSIPRRLRSAIHLRSLRLFDIPNSGYIPPETMATSLSALPQLEFLTIEFRSPTPQPKRRNRPVPPQTRFVLPALTCLTFKGVSEYLEVLTARVEAPLLEKFRITFSHQPVFDIPHIIRFFGYQDFKLFRPFRLTLRFHLHLCASIIFYHSMHDFTRYSMDIQCKKLDWQVFSMAQICNQILSFRSTVRSLDVECFGVPGPEDEIDPMVWLQLFHSFSSVQRLQIYAALEPSIAPTLQGDSESAAEVFPSLRILSIWGNSRADEITQQSIQSFVAARQHSGRPVIVTRRENFDGVM